MLIGELKLFRISRFFLDGVIFSSFFYYSRGILVLNILTVLYSLF
jgi:hypothetical protein